MAERLSEPIHRLIPTDRPEDAVAAYYAFAFPGSAIHSVRKGAEAAVLVTAQSRLGPVGIFRATDPSLITPLLEQLPSGRAYIMGPWSLAAALSRAVEKPERNRIHWLDPGGGSVVEPRRGHVQVEEDHARVVVDGAIASECSLLWRSPWYAELEVRTKPAFRGKGLARAAVSRMADRLLAEGVTPIYVAAVSNDASLKVARSLGFSACREDEFAGYLPG